MKPQIDPARMTPADHADLVDAVQRLEHFGLAVRMSNAFGRQLSFARRLAPERVTKIVDSAATAAMRVALRAAVRSLDNKPVADRNRYHMALAAASGAAGGALGLASLPIELPVTTMVMLRSIADIARSEGEDLADPETALACLEVFALDGRTEGEITESGYFAVRGLLARSVSEAARYIAGRGVIDESAPVMVRLLAVIAKRFGVVVSQKFVAQAAPLLGAFGGAAINVAFTDHFQSLAKGHFTVRRLERKYGADPTKLEYERIAAAKIPDEITPPAA